MSRPPRTQAPGAIYHVTFRGNRRASIYLDEYDYKVWFDMLGEAALRYEIVVHAFCQMPNHYHLVVETPSGNLASAMRYLNGKYCQYFNRKHEFSGHVAQGRYYADRINRQQHLLELARYVVLNPVRAGLVADPADWNASNYHFFMGLAPAPAWLNVDWTLSQFGTSSQDSRVSAYSKFVLQGRGRPDPLRHLTRPRRAGMAASNMDAQPVQTLQECSAAYPDINEAIVRAVLSTTCSLRAIARHFGVSPRTLDRILRHGRQSSN
jgi:REP element-mobilizing transposase RayT